MSEQERNPLGGGAEPMIESSRYSAFVSETTGTGGASAPGPRSQASKVTRPPVVVGAAVDPVACTQARTASSNGCVDPSKAALIAKQTMPSLRT